MASWFRKSPYTSSASLSDLVDTSQPSLWIAVASCLFNPIFWNIVAQAEYRTHFLTKLAGGPYRGCYVLAVTIFSIGILRDHLFNEALAHQPKSTFLRNDVVDIVAYICAGVGGTFVATSMWALGVTGTYLGDYFGILMDHMVTSFPFNVTSSPMYDGSTLLFLATALWRDSPVGILITALVYLEYRIALRFEDAFTAKIYAKRDRERAAAKSGSGGRQGKKEL